jgi:hypothetical protein
LRKGWRILYSGAVVNAAPEFQDKKYRENLEIKLGLKKIQQMSKNKRMDAAEPVGSAGCRGPAGTGHPS